MVAPEALPTFLAPMLLQPGLPLATDSARWALEVKWDGMRAQVRVARDGSWTVRSRPGRDCTDQFPELQALAAELIGREVVLDGKLVSLASDGHADFVGLRRRLSGHDRTAAMRLAVEAPATLMVFDLLHLDGRAVRTLPDAERRELLERLLGDGCGWRVPRPLQCRLDAALAVTKAHGLEGIVAKRLDAPYLPGRRARTWRKHKHRRRETLTVTGWAPATRGSRRLDAFFVARRDAAGTLRPAGAVQLGLAREERDRLRAAIDAARPSRGGGLCASGAIKLEIDFHGRDEGPLRDPVMRALRIDPQLSA